MNVAMQAYLNIGLVVSHYVKKYKRIKMSLILIRGLPGSGKSTRAKKRVSNDTSKLSHIESDIWFEKNGVYAFNPAELSNAHQWCVSSCEFLLRQDRHVIVSNVLASAAECAPYFVLADKYRVHLELSTCTENYGSTHGVPPEKIDIMRLRFESDKRIHDIMETCCLQVFYNNPYDAYTHFLNNTIL
jgi:hypothetical protein